MVDRLRHCSMIQVPVLKNVWGCEILKLPGLCEVWCGYRSGRWASVWCLGGFMVKSSWLPVTFNDDGNDENSENSWAVKVRRHFQDTQGVRSMIQWKMEHGMPSRQRFPWKRTGHNFLNRLMRGKVGGVEKIWGMICIHKNLTQPCWKRYSQFL